MTIERAVLCAPCDFLALGAAPKLGRRDRGVREDRKVIS